jgi:hypothetical protein
VPSTVRDLFAAAGLQPAGVVPWGDDVSERGSGAYVVALTGDPGSLGACLKTCPLSIPTLEDWLEVRPELRLDGDRPSVEELAERLGAIWLPDEVVLYVGLAGKSLRSRVRQYYETQLGAKRPHAGGHFLKTLSNLNELSVHWAPTSGVVEAEDKMLDAFCASVSEETRMTTLDPDHPFPFANLEWPRGTRKRHGLAGTRGDLRTPRSTPSRIKSRSAADSPAAPAGGSRVTLHAEIVRILKANGNRWMSTQELADAVNEAGLYRKRDGSPVSAFQIHGRTRSYAHLFERHGTRVRLRYRR